MATANAESAGDGRVRQVRRIRTRLSQLERQVKSIERMYDDGYPCPEILDQVASTRSALDDLGLLILRDHVRGCFEPVVFGSDQEAAATRLMLAVRRFVASA